MNETDAATRKQIEENIKRYEALKAAGTGESVKAMPKPTGLDEAPIDPNDVLFSETVPGGWYANYKLKAGERIRIASPEGSAAVSMIAWNADLPSERINHADTIKVQWTSALGKGRVLFSDMGRVLLSFLEDTSGAHDVLAGGLNAKGMERKYGTAMEPQIRNTRTNFIRAAAKFGLEPRDIPPFITFFAPVSVADDGALGWREGVRRAGDFVELRAEVNLLIAISTCPHPLDPAPNYAPGSADISILSAKPVAEDDFCRTATPEARRGFENTDAYRNM